MESSEGVEVTAESEDTVSKKAPFVEENLLLEAGAADASAEKAPFVERTNKTKKKFNNKTKKSFSLKKSAGILFILCLEQSLTFFNILN